MGRDYDHDSSSCYICQMFGEELADEIYGKRKQEQDRYIEALNGARKMRQKETTLDWLARTTREAWARDRNHVDIVHRTRINEEKIQKFRKDTGVI
jgi:hypothetical protein